MLDNLTDWDIPVTDEFVARVRRGVRRRRRLRAATTAAAVVVAAIATAAIAAGVVAVTRPPERAQTSPPPVPGTQILDGYHLTRLPAGATRAATTDSFGRYPVTADGPDLSGSPAIGDPAVVVTMRGFDRGVGVSLYVTVFRPDPPGPQVGAWLSAWAARGAVPMHGESAPAGGTSPARPAGTFETPVGPARLLAHQGTEVTTYEVIITTPEQVIITVQANGAFTAAELTDTARGIS
jgi:hypothetical protein